ncbi:MAG TPA: hypothetical protein VIZ90_00840 [Rhizobiaceae bacterium]
MTFRLTSALCILVLAGCTSSEPQNASYAPATEQAAPMHMPPPAPALQGQAGQLPVNGVADTAPPTAPLLQGQAGQFPPNGIATPPMAPALQGQAGQFPPNGIATPGCHTVDNVTLCDVPADPTVDETHYTT